MENRERLLTRLKTEGRLKQALVNHFSKEELGHIFDALPDDANMSADLRALVLIVGESWADYDRPERF